MKSDIHNDLQLGHLNCAYPLGTDAAVVSVLGQGDIGIVDGQGHYRRLLTGYVGCHGVRRSRFSSGYYFADSCGGKIVRWDGDGETREEFDVGSRWLHDVEELAWPVYLCTLGDANQLLVYDVAGRRELGRYGFPRQGANVQFLSATPFSACPRWLLDDGLT